jgi:hypothetical protein
MIISAAWTINIINGDSRSANDVFRSIIDDSRVKAVACTVLCYKKVNVNTRAIGYSIEASFALLESPFMMLIVQAALMIITYNRHLQS